MASLPSVVLALIVSAIFFFVARSIKKLVRNLTRNRREARNLGMVLGRLVQGATILVGLFIALSIVIPSLKASDLVQLLGISGVAIGFAFRDILQNFLAGILLVLTEPFQIDDQIVFKDFEGTVDLVEGSVNIRARWWVKPPRRADVLDLQDRALTSIKNKLTASGIDLPFPTQQILFHDQTEETDGDRTRQCEGLPAGKIKAPQSRSISNSLKILTQTNNTQTNHPDSSEAEGH